MTLTNFDSSLLSKKRMQKTLYAWNVTNIKNVAGGISVRQEQPTYQSADLVSERILGACVYSNDYILTDSSGNINIGSTQNTVNPNPYQFNGLSKCS